MAILNGFGRTLGDGIIGLQALSVALALGRVPPRPVLFRLTGLPGAIRALYTAAAFCECRDLDWPELDGPVQDPDPAAEFGGVLDLRDFAFDPAFRGMAMIDYFLSRLGLDPARVSASQRRNAWLAQRLVPSQPAMPPGYVLVCPRASMALRAMPDAVHAAVLAGVRRLGVPVATQGANPPGGHARMVPSTLALPELCGWVAAARLVVTTDTAIVHLADAFAVPCLAVFTTHRPEWRARDYPLCRSLHRPVAGLPPALEFARGPEDVAAAHAAWLDAGSAGWLTDAVAAMLADLMANTLDDVAGGRLVRLGWP